MLDTTRREFIALIGGGCLLLAVKVKRAWGQQPAMPVVGFLSGRSPSESAYALAAFHQGLKQGGYVEGQNVAIEYRWAEGQYDRLPALVVDLLRHQVSVIAATGGIGSAWQPKRRRRQFRSCSPAVTTQSSWGLSPVSTGPAATRQV